MESSKDLTKHLTYLSLKYQDYLTLLGIIWTIGVSIIIAFLSYILVYYSVLTMAKIISFGIIVISLEIIFISLHFWIMNEERSIKNRIRNI